MPQLIPLRRRIQSCFLFAVLLFAPLGFAAEPAQTCVEGTCRVVYEPGFFSRYAPVSALDMVRNLPGFTLAEGDESRGFGGASGNLLINGERVSAKNEQPSDLLRRIPAADIAYIELIRGQLGGLDLQGQSVVANVVRAGQGGEGTWTIGLVNNRPDDKFLPFANLSYAGNRFGWGYTASLELEEYQGLRDARERVLDGGGQLRERRRERFDETGEAYALALTATGAIAGTQVAFSGAYRYFDEAGGERSERVPIAASPFVLFQGDTDQEDAFELGLDLERELPGSFSAKLIGLYQQADYRETGSLIRTVTPAAPLRESETVFDSLNTEQIVRLELDFTGWTGHLVELAVEAAVNELDTDFALRTLEGDVLVAQPVPGASTRVTESRLDLRLSDAFALGPVGVELALGAEDSTIKQTGDVREERSFQFLKPSLALNATPRPNTQLRLRVRRVVGQLDFFDFVSTADLGDVELALGNPSLAPESTVATDLRFEQRFGDLGVLALTGFHDRIDDVIDVLPLEGILEVPGNIGRGTRSGLRFEATAPVPRIKSLRFDAAGAWQRSSVDDPLTGRSRPLSDEAPWELELSLRQDLPSRGLAWEVSYFTIDNVPRLGLDEAETVGRRWDVEFFVERRWRSGRRARFGVDNLFRNGRARDRRVFNGPRTDGVLSFQERRRQRFSRLFYLELSGTL